VVKKTGALKISHEAFRAKKMAGAKKEWMATFETAVAEQQGIAANLGRASEDLNPLKVLELFKRVTAEVREREKLYDWLTMVQDAELLALHPDVGRPEDYIWQYISVPPPCIRPSVASESGKSVEGFSLCDFPLIFRYGSNEDDLTAKLAEIVHLNKMLEITMERGQGIEMTMVRRSR